MFSVQQSFAAAAVLAISTARFLAVVVGLLVVIGLVMVVVGARLVRSTRADHPALGPLEVIGERRWLQHDPPRRAAELDDARPAGAAPLAAQPAEESTEPDVDTTTPEAADAAHTDDPAAPLPTPDAEATDGPEPEPKPEPPSPPPVPGPPEPLPEPVPKPPQPDPLPEPEPPPTPEPPPVPVVEPTESTPDETAVPVPEPEAAEEQDQPDR